MQDAGLSVEEAGRLFYDAGERVNVELLGACLGHHADPCKELAQRYPINFSCFAGMDIVSAIRAYLWRFRLPGEAAQIERIVEGFARAYFEHNPPAHSSTYASVGCSNVHDSGWYVEQPRSCEPCCAHCGALDGDNGVDLRACQGCKLLLFCRKCCKMAHQRGHAVVGAIGYGRACVAAQRREGVVDANGKITYQEVRQSAAGKTTYITTEIKDAGAWERASPFRSQDAVMILAFAIIMLSTNLHSVKVKQKMAKHEFLKQNRDVNDGKNFPGDFLSEVYDNVQQQELEVMRTVFA